MSEATHSLDQLLNRRVVIDTSGSMVYIGTLVQHGSTGYWLTDADVHDRSDGHSTKEFYINQAHEMEHAGTRRVNRRRVFVERHAVFSLAALDDIVTEETSEDGSTWLE
jgi:hypothetical protein